MSSLPAALPCFKNGNILDLFATSLKLLHLEDIERMAFHLWSIWISRNKWVMQQQKEDCEEIYQRSVRLLTEYKGINYSSTMENRTSLDWIWKPPNTSVYELNVDASFNATRSQCCLGGSNPKLGRSGVAAGIFSIEHPPTVDEAEAMAILQGMDFAHNLHFFLLKR